MKFGDKIIINGKTYVVLDFEERGGFIGTDRSWTIKKIEIAEDRGKDNPECWIPFNSQVEEIKK